MPFDLMLSEHGDLVFAASRDLQGVGGTAQVAQSIRTRLKIPRGTWDYDEDETLGSQLTSLSGVHPDQLQSHAEVMVREALREMEDVVVDKVTVENVENNLVISVEFHLSGISAVVDFTEIDALTFSIPLGG